MYWKDMVLAMMALPSTKDIQRLKEELEDYENLFVQCDLKLMKARENANLYAKQVDDLQEQISTCEHKLQWYELDKQQRLAEGKLEHYWNHKRPPRVNFKYPARDGVQVDPRIFYQPYDSTLVAYKNDTFTFDEKASRCLNYVQRTIQYISEKKEYWQFSYETMKRRAGDCEDGAVLLANMMLASGIPYWRIRLNAGWVHHPKAGKEGHCYVTYLREEDNQWYVLDWCYWYKESKDFKRPWSDAEGKYFDIWFSWNAKYVYGSVELDR